MKSSRAAKILIVEDSRTQAMQLEYTLERHGFDVSCARNGQEALAMMAQEPPMIVISDVVMPEMDGYELCRRVKSDESLKQVPVILLTSLSDPIDVFRGLECGADNFIIKPWEEHYLLSRIEYILANMQLRQTEKTEVGLIIFFKDKKYYITSDRLQILNLLLGTYENAVQKNLELIQTRDELKRLNERLEEMVQERTSALMAEIAERERVEEEVRRLNAELEQRVIERTAELEIANRELNEAKEEAERANRAKSEFLSRMSHELRTPLNAILGFAQLMEMDQPTEEQRESIDQILKGGRHLLGLINEVLDIARIEAGRLLISPEPVSLCDTVQEVVDLVRPLASQQDVELRAELEEECSRYVMADRQRLKQVLLNLLSNAVKYNHPGGTATVACEQTPEGEPRLRVSDSGKGIAAEKLARLFTPFDRLGAEQTGIEGTGLGLALSNRLVELMGGRLQVESRVDEGSTFWVELPGVQGQMEEYHRAVMEGEIPLDHSFEGCTILYVEDNLSNLRLIERILDWRPGVKLIAAMQGSLGLELAQQNQPDLILLDQHLPDMLGEQVLYQLREDPRTEKVPVVILSADATTNQIEQLEMTGVHAYLTKPLDVKRFLRVLDEVLRKGDH